jgi:hypothetical protein
MNGQLQLNSLPLPGKIARLIQERGWNWEDFARLAQLNRQTVRQIIDPDKPRKLRNTTVSACAKALGLSVMDLRTLPLDALLERMNGPVPVAEDENLRRLYDRATQPEMVSWLERNPERARQLATAEIDELLSLQGTGGPLTGFGVERFVEMIERKRRLIQQVQTVAGTEYLDVLEKVVALMYEKIQPYGQRK